MGTRGWLITHQDCLDGATAALVGIASGLSPVFCEPDRVVDAINALTEPGPVYLADVSLRLPDWDRYRDKIAWLLDHHQSALNLAGQPRVTIDQSRSGAHLMYDFAVSQRWLSPHPNWRRLVLTVQRYDLWQPHHGLGQNLNRLFHKLGWEWYRTRFARGWVPYTSQEGAELAKILLEERQFIARHVARARRRQLDGHGLTLAAVALDEDGSVNEICHTLLQDGAQLVLVVKPDGRLSARSGERIDAAQLMERAFAGGGHARAAGGRLPADWSAEDDNILDALLQRAADHLSRQGLKA